MNHNLVTNQLDYEYTNEGHKETIVFAHGLGSSRQQWHHQVDHFKKQYNVLTFSFLGHGASPMPLSYEGFSIQTYANDVIGLLDELNIRSCHWVGNSMGGVIGYQVMQDRPDMINSIFTNGTATKLEYSPTMLKFIYFTDKLLIRLLGHKKYTSIAVKAILKDPDAINNLHQIFQSSSPEAAIYGHQMLGDYDYVDLLTHTSIPVCILQTPNDKDINNALKKYKVKEIEAIEFLSLPKGGHVVNMEFPKAYNDVLDSFLKANSN